MARIGSVILGVGLVILWIVGMNHGATTWLTWMDGLAGLVFFIIAGLATAEAGRGGAGAPVVVGFALIVFWLVGLGVRATSWLSWWTFVFGCAGLTLAIVSMSHLRGLHHQQHHAPT
jgi:hypothetical protein